MLLEDNGERESPLLPSFTELVLVDSALSSRKALRLCDALMKRVEQGVPLETLDLRQCPATSSAIALLSEIVVDVLRPERCPEIEAQIPSDAALSKVLGLCAEGSSGVEGFNESDTGSDHEVRDIWEIGYKYGEDEADYW
ncbi:hypothetical protein EDB89DRAFT_2071824 [Lactarius sanguifluus]|nr:hypothetical protein EDB89DRAFT_2071824 [Lactarius sanguifluus]